MAKLSIDDPNLLRLLEKTHTVMVPNIKLRSTKYKVSEFMNFMKLMVIITAGCWDMTNALIITSH